MCIRDSSHADRARTIALLVAGGSVFLIGAAWALFTPLRRTRDEATTYRDIEDRDTEDVDERV
mgnify:FL=1